AMQKIDELSVLADRQYLRTYLTAKDQIGMPIETVIAMPFGEGGDGSAELVPTPEGPLEGPSGEEIPSTEELIDTIKEEGIIDESNLLQGLLQEPSQEAVT
ncbi:hypothetical protein KY311_04630, partial [Candidatus Woesearchaeota archaeon]|nr:hypothetical protein [Candidatus Woesearchaeota archaeon]